MNVEDVINSAFGRAEVIHCRSAMYPFLWASSTSPVLLIAAFVVRSDTLLAYSLIGLGAAPIVVALVAYFYYLNADPDRLHSAVIVIRKGDRPRLVGGNTDA